MTSSFVFGIAGRLLSVGIAITLGLAALAVLAYVNLNQGARVAAFTEQQRVPQLRAVDDIEFNIARTGGELRHAMLARTPQEMTEALTDIRRIRQTVGELLQAYELRLNSGASQLHFERLRPRSEAFWRVVDANIALIEQGQRDEAFGHLVQALVPARNALLAELAQGAQIEAQGLTADMAQIQRDMRNTSKLLALLALMIGLALLALSWRVAALLRRRVAAARAVAERVRNGDLSTPIADGAQDEFMPLLAALRDMQTALTAVVVDVRRSAEGVAAASAQIERGNTDLSQRTEQQAAALEQTSASMTQLGCTARQNADHARQASQLAASASAVAVQGGVVVGQVVQTMHDINTSSRKISDIIGVIDGIAFQTNILALNAAVEAARAGEQGRGFAVVAAEVRHLAQRSAEAAREIKGLIGASVQRVEQGSQLVNQAGSTMQEIVQSIQRVTDIVGEISSSSAEQNTGVAQVSEAVAQMDQSTQQNAALVQESASAASSLRQQAQQLVQTVGVFKLPGAAGASAAQAPATYPTAPPARGRSSTVHKAVYAPAHAGRKVSGDQASSRPTSAAAAAPQRSGTDDWESF